MKKIIVFTDIGKLSTVKRSFVRRADVSDLGKEGSMMLLFNSENKNFSPTSDLLADGLYLVYDRIPEKKFKQLIYGDSSDWYILKHSEPNFIKGFKNVRKGRHAGMDNGGLIYPHVVRILQDGKGNEVERVFDAIFKIDHIKEQKIKLIRAIQNDETPEDMPHDLRDFQFALDKFKLFKEMDWLSKEYTDAFEQLLIDLQIEN